MVTHDTVEVGLIRGEFEVGEETEGAEREGEDGWDDTLEEPRGVEDGAITAEGEDEVKDLGGGPAKIGSPVSEHTFVARVDGEQGGSVEVFGVA